ncbi:MAG: 16S rRNA (uracil(1498)-N(3))-methyltransferase [Inhella sp.]|uniref:16S rRNA (uracil(1498)-N(3))-methyltransferase n=1 Tax=Inhella sp. TaxID=1921806 RepID=UPI0022BEF7A5|nr:16S rRNA (uracil(1498)-N(3))-methyltransferase [Inhella sp.]MCZ8234053.1 16S rRNA (uracil(1498)-N(3))-methyltransferase [Inhella sp.]
MPARLFVDLPLSAAGQVLDLPPGPTRHAQVLRLQPGDAITVFDGRAPGQWTAEVTHMGRSVVQVVLRDFEPLERELSVAVTLAVVMPANDRMDFLVEKATELGAMALQPLVAERSVLRLSGERADKKVAHWQGVAQAAAEQCGRVRVPRLQPVRPLAAWLNEASPGLRWLASPGADPLKTPAPWPSALTLLTGPEGGLSPAEEAAAVAAGFVRVGLGHRILRADTAPLSVLAWVGLATGA